MHLAWALRRSLVRTQTWTTPAMGAASTRSTLGGRCTTKAGVAPPAPQFGPGAVPEAWLAQGWRVWAQPGGRDAWNWGGQQDWCHGSGW